MFFVVVSPHRRDRVYALSAIEAQATVDRLSLSGIDATVAEGAYMGDVEPSIVIRTSVDRFGLARAFDTARGLGLAWAQESILVVRDGLAELHYLDGRSPAAVGRWTPVDSTEAHGSPGYTRIGSTYFVCK